MANQELNSDGLKALWLKEADAREASGDRAAARKMRRAADSKRAWNRVEKELRKSQASHGTIDWSSVIKTLLPLLLNLLQQWLG